MAFYTALCFPNCVRTQLVCELNFTQISQNKNVESFSTKRCSVRVSIILRLRIRQMAPVGLLDLA